MLDIIFYYVCESPLMLVRRFPPIQRTCTITPQSKQLSEKASAARCPRMQVALSDALSHCLAHAAPSQQRFKSRMSHPRFVRVGGKSTSCFNRYSLTSLSLRVSFTVPFPPLSLGPRPAKHGRLTVVIAGVSACVSNLPYGRKIQSGNVWRDSVKKFVVKLDREGAKKVATRRARTERYVRILVLCTSFEIIPPSTQR